MTERHRRDLCFSRPTSTRIQNFAMGGKDNYSLDRATALRFVQALPILRLLPAENRRFMRRAVRFMLSQGVRQFIDVGCGLPGKGNVHELVHRVDPSAPVVYVDIDPVAVVHFRALVHTEPNTIALEADARDPHGILNHREVTRLIDFGRPVGVLMITMLAQIREEADPDGVVRAFGDAMAPGGQLALCELTDEAMTTEERDLCQDLLCQAELVAEFRSRERIARLLDGLEPVEPGLVAAPDWRPDRPYDPPSGWLLGTVARKPS
jgi:SAM-dependent methyltransferase